MKQKMVGRRLRAVAGISVLGLALTACGSSDDSASDDGEVLDRTIKVAVFPSFNGLDGYVAQSEGYFEEEGLDVELVTAGAPSAMMPQLLGGSLDLALMDMVTPIVATSKKVPIVAVAPGATGTNYQDGDMGVGNLWVRSDSDIDSVKELENTTFAVPQIGSAVWMDVREAVDDAGGDSSKMKFVEVQDQLGALLAGDVDAASSSEPRGTDLLGDPALERLDNYITMDGDLAYMYMTTTKLAEQSPETFAAFERAILKANAFINENPEEAVEVAASYIDAPKELLAEAVYPEFEDESITPEQIDAVIKRMVRYDLVEEAAAPSADDLVLDQD